MCIFGSRTFVPISGMCKKQTSVSRTESEIISLDAALRMDGLPALDLWALVIEVLRTCQGISKPTQASTRETGVVPHSTPKIQQVLDQNVDLSNIDQVPSNAHLSGKESQLFIFDDNEAVIKMIIKGRSPRMRHVFRTHRVALDWLFDRRTSDRKIQIKYVESKNQLAYFQTKGSFMRGEWHNLLRLFNIMNGTTFSCSHLSNRHPFLSAGKYCEMSKRLQEGCSPVSPIVKAKTCCLVSRHSVSVGQNSSSNPTSLGSTSYSQVWKRGERSTNSRCYSVQPASGNRGYGTENSGGLSETPASGNREYMQKVFQNVKDRLRHNEGVSEISMDSEKVHISIWTLFMASSTQAALHMDPNYAKNLEIFKNSEFENIESLFNVTNMMIGGNSEIKNFFPTDSANPSWERSTLPTDQSIEWTKARENVYSDSVLGLGKTLDLEDVSHLQRTARVRWRAD